MLVVLVVAMLLLSLSVSAALADAPEFTDMPLERQLGVYPQHIDGNVSGHAIGHIPWWPPGR